MDKEKYIEIAKGLGFHNRLRDSYIAIQLLSTLENIVFSLIPVCDGDNQKKCLLKLLEDATELSDLVREQRNGLQKIVEIEMMQ